MFIGLNSFNNDFPFFWKITLLSFLKTAGLFIEPLLFLHKGICHIVFCSQIFARFVQNPYTWAKIIMLLFTSNQNMARGFFSSFYFLYMQSLISVCFWLINPLAILYCVILSPDIMDNSQSCRNCTDFCNCCVNVVQKVESLCLAHLSA